MREIENANELHKSDNDYNKIVVRLIKDTKRAKDTRDLLDIRKGAKSWQEVEERAEWEMEETNNPQEGKTGLANSTKDMTNMSNTQKRQSGNELVENVIDKNVNVVVEEVGEEER